MVDGPDLVGLGPEGTKVGIAEALEAALSEADTEEWIAELTEAACSTGQTVVVRATISVTTMPAEAELRAGQLVTVGAQLVMVWI